MVKAARSPETPNEDRNAREAVPQGPAKSAAELKSQIDVKAQTQAQVDAFVKPRTQILLPAIDDTFELDDAVRNNPQYPQNIVDPYRTIA